jgi:hypothetical protein
MAQYQEQYVVTSATHMAQYQEQYVVTSATHMAQDHVSPLVLPI